MKHIKSLFLVLLAPLFLGLTSCSDENSEKVLEPTITLTAGEASGSSLTFSIETTNATKACWVVVPAENGAPAIEDVLSKGSPIAVNKKETITAPGLNPNTEYIIAGAVIGEKEELKKLNSITMTTGEKGFTLQLQVTISDIEHDEAAYVVTATEQDSPYFFNVVEESKIADKSEDQLYQEFIQKYAELAGEENMSIFEYLEDQDLIFWGNQEGRFTDLTPSTKYVAVAFGFDENNARTSEFVNAPFETIALEYPLELEIVLGEPTPNSVPITVNVNDENLTYVIQAVYTEQIAEFSNDEIFEGYMGSWAESAAQYEMDLYEFLGAAGLLMKGSIQGEFPGLKSDTDYTIIAWGVDEECEQISEVERIDFSTPPTPQTGLTFDLKVEDITENSAHLIVTPSDLSETFVWLCQPMQDPNWTAESIMNDYVNQWGGFLNSGMGLSSGIQDYVSKSLIPNTDYYFIAFGYNGGITSEPIMLTFRTLAGADESEFDCEFTVTQLDAHNVKLKVTPNYNSIFYMFGAVADGELDIEQTKAWVEEDIALGYEEFLIYNPGYSLADFVNMVTYNGESYGSLTDLEEQTSYTVFAFPVTTEGLTTDHHIIIESFFTTPAYVVSDAWMTNEYHKVFDGDEVTERGLFDGADCTGRGIMTMAFDASDDAVQIFHYIAEGDATSTDEYSDEYLWNNLNWIELEGGIENNPYGFYLIDWSYTYTIMTVAKDANGHFGVVDRTLVTPRKANVSPIEELVAMLNASSAPRRYCVAPDEMTSLATPQLNLGKEVPVITRPGLAR